MENNKSAGQVILEQSAKHRKLAHEIFLKQISDFPEDNMMALFSGFLEAITVVTATQVRVEKGNGNRQAVNAGKAFMKGSLHNATKLVETVIEGKK